MIKPHCKCYNGTWFCHDSLSGAIGISSDIKLAVSYYYENYWKFLKINTPGFAITGLTKLS